MSFQSAQSAPEVLKSVDPIWFEVKRDAEAIVRSDPAMASFVYRHGPQSSTGSRTRSSTASPSASTTRWSAPK